MEYNSAQISIEYFLMTKRQQDEKQTLVGGKHFWVTCLMTV